MLFFVWTRRRVDRNVYAKSTLRSCEAISRSTFPPSLNLHFALIHRPTDNHHY